jgi:peptide-methionine (S)-S-oxide reductase
MQRIAIAFLAILLTSLSMGAHAAEEKAIFAGGCFWCLQPVYDQTEGVTATFVGYTGGHVENPTYEQVTDGKTGHVEAIEVTYDPQKVQYETLVQLFWENIDPFNARGQFADRGPQYETVIFYDSEAQKRIAEITKATLQTRFGNKKIATRIEPASEFYPAEEYHQEYYAKNPTRYNLYKHGSGRVQRLKELWGK